MKGKIIFGIVIILIILGIFWSKNSYNECKIMPVNEINIGGHSNLAMHIHSTLKIIINDEEQEIPSNIGINGNIMRPIHTHDQSGKLHLESKCWRDFKLGEFFDVWGMKFDNQCIFEYCSNEEKELKVYVNGEKNLAFRDILLKDGDVIDIRYD